MKKLLNLLVFSIIIFNANSQKHYAGCSGSISDVIVYDIKNTNTYNGKKETDIISKFDSLDRVTLERFIIDRFNYYRQNIGSKALQYDSGIRPAAYHHALYQRLAGKQSHYEDKDIPNFTELELADRYNLLDQNKFKSINEGLINQGFQIPSQLNEDCPKVTYKELVDQFFTPGMGYPTSDAHWSDIMNPKWDAICIYYDFEWVVPVTKETFYIMANVTLVYAKYK
jgi:hypothetical protein